MSPLVLHGMLECLQNSYTHEYPLRNRCNIEKFRMLGRIKCGQVFDLLSTEFVPPRSTRLMLPFFLFFFHFIYIYIFSPFNCFTSNVEGANFRGKNRVVDRRLAACFQSFRIVSASKVARNYFYSTTIARRLINGLNGERRRWIKHRDRYRFARSLSSRFSSRGD